MPTRRRRPGVTLLVTLVLAAVIVAGVGVLLDNGAVRLPGTQGCTARVEGHTVSLTVEQAENASLIAAESVRRGLPPRAASIALATAYQESKLRNLDHGDRDSVGLFQQRPSQGWGTSAQIQNPRYAINKFYDALVLIDGYTTMRITEAAQRVQRSGYPEAYAAHEADARALASALTGYSRAAFSCQDSGPGTLRQQPIGPGGLTARAARVRTDLEKTFGTLSLGGFAPGGVSTGHGTTSAHYSGRALDVFVRPISAAHTRKGWAVASYLVAHAVRFDIEHVIFDRSIWSNGSRSGQGWRTYKVGNQPGDRAILEHRDHVHVDVAAG